MKPIFLFYIAFAFGASFYAQNKIELKHIEPMNWWSNMHLSKIEIMLHGENIAKYEVKVEGLDILGIQKTENDNYIFVTVETKNKAPKVYPITLMKGKKEIYKYPFELKKRTENSRFRQGFDASDVIYLLMPDRFANGNIENDSDPTVIEKLNREKPGGRHGGDIQGIIDHLDYIADLGATAIWTTPLLEDNDSTYSYHTYGQSNVYRVDPRYGTNDDFKRLVEEAHKKGLKIIKDEVPNHWGGAHWMMKDLPTYEWIHQFPGYGQSNYRTTTHMDPNVSEYDKLYCEKGWFVKSMPDLNQSHPLVLHYLIQNTIWWMEFAGIDGIRVDTYSFNDKDAIATWTKAIMEEYPNTNITGEVWMHDQAQISYWQKNSPVGAIDNYNSYLPSVMDFTLQDAFEFGIKESDMQWTNGMIRFYENFVNDFLYENPQQLLIFTENHDTPRFNEYCPDIKDYKIALSMLATLRGIPQIYYGSEIGMQGSKAKGDADIRRDFPGGWKEDSVNAFLGKGLNAAQQEYYEFTRKILNWRKSNSIAHNGKFIHYIPVENVYVYFREDPSTKEKIMVLINNSKKNKDIDLFRYKESLVGISKGKDVASERVFNLKNSLSIEGKTALILTLE